MGPPSYMRSVVDRNVVMQLIPVNLNEDIMKCLNTYCNTNLYVSTTVFITQGNM